ncbi:MAG: sugar transferase [Caldilineaceae bacterium]|nr:sugar transferase [Caldilineaceae bacterium]
MFKRFSVNYMALLFIIDGIVIQLTLVAAMQLRYILPLGQLVRPEWVRLYAYVPGPGLHLAVAILWLVSFISFNVYTPRKIVRWFDETQRLVLAHTISALSLAGLLYLANVELLRLIYGYFYLLALFLMLGYRGVLRVWHRAQQHRIGSVARILVVGAGRVGCDTVQEFHRHQWPGIEFVGFLDDDPDKLGQMVSGLPVLGTIDAATQIIDTYDIDEVLVALPPRAHIRLANLVARLYERPVRVRVVPDYFELAFFGATVESLGGIPLIGLRDPAIDGFQRFVKRLFDIATSATTLLLLAPIMATVALAIKLEDRGPILYRAPRVGENGKIFYMLKFRSMVVGADQLQSLVNKTDPQGRLVHKRADDPRITRVGRIIRRTSIDEFPQLINVLKGEMSLVGPRPELPWLVEKYEPWQRKRFAVPQGITGWWQVNGRSDNLMHLHTDQDLYYIQNYSFWLDVQILWRTLGVVLRGRGAY